MTPQQEYVALYSQGSALLTLIAEADKKAKDATT